MLTHQTWLLSLYSQYKSKQINQNSEVNLDEIKYRSIDSEETFSNFEEEWLKNHPPLLKRQHGFETMRIQLQLNDFDSNPESFDVD